MKKSRRKFIQAGSLAGIGAALVGFNQKSDGKSIEVKTSKSNIPKVRHNPIGVSTYSFWQFNGPKEETPVEMCIEKAAAMGFDGVELLLYQMTSEENSYLQKLKKQAFHAGLDLSGFSTHQGYLNPDKAYRDENIKLTIHQIELAYKLGIPTMRLNTGRWGTGKRHEHYVFYPISQHPHRPTR